MRALDKEPRPMMKSSRREAMRIFVMGAGHMGSWFVEELCQEHEVAVYDADQSKLKYFYRVKRFQSLDELAGFSPELAINAVSLHRTIEAFEAFLPFLGPDCLIADIASVKQGLPAFYEKAGRRFVSTHPMFGPTFANIRDLSDQNAILIPESDKAGLRFIDQFYRARKLSIFEYGFDEHDRTTAYSLSIPFASSIVFAACMRRLDAPGTTFKKHLATARGVLSEDDLLLAEILFNPYTIPQIEKINAQLSYLTHILKDRDKDELSKYLAKLRANIAISDGEGAE